MMRWIVVVALAMACAEDPVGVTPGEGTVGEGDHIDLGTAPYRARRRMDVDQLEASLERVTGGVQWVRGTTNQWDRFRDTLGVPDFESSTSEDTSPSLLFLKFLDDAARFTCDQLVRRETGDEAQGVLFLEVDPEDAEASEADVRANLSALLLRYHGRRVDADADELAPWVRLYERTLVGVPGEDGELPDPSPARAWESVCVGLVNHPDFYTY